MFVGLQAGDYSVRFERDGALCSALIPGFRFRDRRAWSGSHQGSRRLLDAVDRRAVSMKETTMPAHPCKSLASCAVILTLGCASTTDEPSTTAASMSANAKQSTALEMPKHGMQVTTVGREIPAGADQEWCEVVELARRPRRPLLRRKNRAGHDRIQPPSDREHGARRLVFPRRCRAARAGSMRGCPRVRPGPHYARRISQALHGKRDARWHRLHPAWRPALAI